MDTNDPLAYNSNQNTTSFKTHVLEFIETLVVFLAIGTIIYLFIAQPHKVSGSSMYPNFHSGDYIITNKIGYRFTQPQRGQVIVFENPKDLSQDFIKRIIGLPGERVKVESGHVYINDKLLNEPYLSSTIETLPGSFMSEGVDITVPKDNYLAFGDNRPASSDSREWGFLTRDEIIGQSIFIYWPPQDAGLVPMPKYNL